MKNIHQNATKIPHILSPKQKTTNKHQSLALPPPFVILSVYFTTRAHLPKKRHDTLHCIMDTMINRSSRRPMSSHSHRHLGTCITFTFILCYFFLAERTSPSLVYSCENCLRGCKQTIMLKRGLSSNSCSLMVKAGNK